jgi:hypothetical protein
MDRFTRLFAALERIFGKGFVSRLMGKQSNVITLPSKDAQRFLTKELNILEASEGAINIGKQDLEKIVSDTKRLSQLNDQELLVITNNAERLAQRVNPNVGPDAEVINLGTKEKVSPEGIMQLKEKMGQQNAPGTLMGDLEGGINKLKASGEDLSKMKGQTLDELMGDFSQGQKTMLKLEDEGLVRATAREIIGRDIKSGKIKLPKELEQDIVQGGGDPVNIWRQFYGEDALEKLDSMVPEFRNMYSPKEAADAAVKKFNFNPQLDRPPGSISIDDAKKAEKEFNIIPADSEEGKIITEKLIGKPKASVTELVTAEKIILDMKKMDPMDAMKEANKVLKKEGKYKNLQEKDVKRIMDDTNDFIFGRDIPEDPEGFAVGGRVGMASGGIAALKTLIRFLGKDSGKKGSKMLKEINPKQFGYKFDMLDPEMKNAINKNRLEYLENLSDVIKADKKLLREMKDLPKEWQDFMYKQANEGGNKGRLDIYNKINIDDAIGDIEQMKKNLEFKDIPGKEIQRKMNAEGGSQGLDYLMGIERRGYAEGSYLDTLYNKPNLLKSTITPENIKYYTEEAVEDWLKQISGKIRGFSGPDDYAGEGITEHQWLRNIANIPDIDDPKPWLERADAAEKFYNENLNNYTNAEKELRDHIRNLQTPTEDFSDNLSNLDRSKYTIGPDGNTYEIGSGKLVSTKSQTPETPTEDFSDYLNTSSVNTIAQTTPETPTEDFSDYLNTAEVPREDAMVSPEDALTPEVPQENPIQQHLDFNEFLKGQGLSQQDYNVLGGRDVAQNLAPGNPILGGVVNLASPFYNLVQTFDDAKDAQGNVIKQYVPDMYEDATESGAYYTVPAQNFLDIPGSAARNIQGGLGLLSDRQKQQYQDLRNQYETQRQQDQQNYQQRIAQVDPNALNTQYLQKLQNPNATNMDQFKSQLQSNLTPTPMNTGGRVGYAYGSGLKILNLFKKSKTTLQKEIKKSMDNIGLSGDSKLDADMIVDDILETMGVDRNAIDGYDILNVYDEAYKTITKPKIKGLKTPPLEGGKADYGTYKFTGKESMDDLYELERLGKITRDDMNVYDPRYMEYLDAQIINKEQLYTRKEWEKTPETIKNKIRGRIDPDWQEANFGEDINWDQIRGKELEGSTDNMKIDLSDAMDDSRIMKEMGLQGGKSGDYDKFLEMKLSGELGPQKQMKTIKMELFNRYSNF